MVDLQQKKLSIIAASYNDSGNIRPLYERVMRALEGLVGEIELIYADDGSTDDSEAIYRELSAKDARVQAILMSRNFRSSQPGFFAGLCHCAGDAAVLMDGDLQDPPEVIPALVQKWAEGYDVVYGIRKKRKGNIIRRAGYKLFYRVFKKLAYINTPLDAGDFSCMDRKVINEIIKFREKDIRIRGLRAYVGFKQTGVEYVREERFAGQAHTSMFTDLRFAKDLILNFSYKPLEWISRLGFLVVLFSFLLLAVNIIFYFISPEAPRGIPTVILLLLFLGGVQLLSIAVIGEYVGKIFEEVKRRPTYIIREIIKRT